MAGQRLPYFRGRRIDQTDLHRFVPVGGPGLALHHNTGARLDDGGRHHRAVLGEQLRHADFSADDSVDHMVASQSVTSDE